MRVPCPTMSWGRRTTAAVSITKQTRRELVAAVRDRYLKGALEEKHRILDEFVVVTGYHRKHAIRVLRSTGSIPRPRQATSRSVYDEAVREALGVLWEASDRICGKRLKALIPVLLPSLEKHGHVKLEQTVRERVLDVSASTIDRLLADRRESAGGRRRRPRARPRASNSTLHLEARPARLVESNHRLRFHVVEERGIDEREPLCDGIREVPQRL